METVAHWCSIDTRTGSLTCVLEENNCFDAEMYADDLVIEEDIEFKEDQRSKLPNPVQLQTVLTSSSKPWKVGATLSVRQLHP
jgi:hypothetical protein